MALIDPINGFTPVWLDYETQSECDLKACGSYVYAEHPTTKVLCAAIMLNGHRIFWTMDKFNIGMPHGVHYAFGYDFIRNLFLSPIIAIAHHVDFERPITLKTLKLPDPPGGWRDTMDQTLMRGLPAGADAAGQYLFGMGKDQEGYALMMKTCKPNRNGVMPVITDDVMRRYVIYNFRDTEIQYGISEKFGIDITPEREQQVNQLHRAINHRGVQVDTEFAQTLRSFDEAFKSESRRQVEIDTLGAVKGKDLTRNDFLRGYLKTQGLELDNMRADQIESILEADEDGEIELSTEIYSVLTNRMVVSRAALAKVETALRGTCQDGRIYALLRYWGARTGRWSGARLQIQNMKRPDEDFDLEAAIEAVEDNDIDRFQELCKGKRPYELLSSLVRGILIPRPGCKFIVGDYSQIEARVLLWMAEDWGNLQEHVDFDLGLGPNIYCRFASFLYQKPIPNKKAFPKEYGVGKIGELACLAEGTPILTKSGWKRIENIDRTDLIWDGDGWTSSGGSVFQGVKPCVCFHGVEMTTDHRVFLDDTTVLSFDDMRSDIRKCWNAHEYGMSSMWRLPLHERPQWACYEQPRYVSRADSSELINRRTYDILDCGPKNRFQAWGLLVHNCGYQGGIGAVNRFAYSGGVDLAADGIAPQMIVDGWRKKHPLVCDMWYLAEDAFRRCMRNQGKEYIAARCAFTSFPDRVEIRLPSGRKLTYMNARLEESRRAGWEGSTVIVYDSAVKGRVKREEIYGGKIIENIDQAIARDLLADAMIRIDETGDEIVMHVHDEVVVEAPEECVEEVRQSVEDIMKVVPEWAKGMPVNAKPEIMSRYGK